MADSIISRIGIVAYINAESVDACVEKERRKPPYAYTLRSGISSDSYVLWGRAYVRETNAYGNCRVLRWWVVHLWVEGFLKYLLQW